jgi:2'-5' RNA ligase
MRIFVALDLTAAIRQNIATLMEGIRPYAPEARWVRPESLHVTLKFIGEQKPESVEEIQHQLAGIRVPPFEMSLRGYGFFPTAKSPRVFWVGIQAGEELAALAAQVDSSLVSVPREQHAFSPHLTLARDGGRSGAPRRQKGDRPHSRFHLLQERLEKLPPMDFGTMRADAFFLYQSHLGPGGSKYTKLARFPLQQSGESQK